MNDTAPWLTNNTASWPTNDASPWMMSDLWLMIGLLFYGTATLLAIGYIWMRIRRFLLQRAEKSENSWDNVILHAVQLPITFIIFIFVVYHAGNFVFEFWGSKHPRLKDFPSFLNSLVIVGVVGAIFWALLRLMSGMENVYRTRKIVVGGKVLDAGSVHAIFRALRIIIFIIALLTGISSLGVSISGILAFGGMGSLLIGFAIKDTLANFFSNMLIFWERSFVVGDWVRLPDANVEGVVEKIGWRMTQIRTFDKRPVYVPNSLFSNSVIENPQRMTNRRIYEYMGVRYADVSRLPALLKDIRDMLRNHPEINQEDSLIVNFDRYGASSVDFFVYAMTNTTKWGKYHQIKEEILFNIATLVEKHQCEFAFPTRTLHHLPAPPPLPPAPQ